MSVRPTRRAVVIGVSACAGTFGLGLGTTGHADAATTHEVRIKAFKFVPRHLEVKLGDKIRWINDDLAPHTATAIGVSWDTGELLKRQSGVIEVREGMELTYFCAFHPHMKGTLALIA